MFLPMKTSEVQVGARVIAELNNHDPTIATHQMEAEQIITLHMRSN